MTFQVRLSIICEVLCSICNGGAERLYGSAGHAFHRTATNSVEIHFDIY